VAMLNNMGFTFLLFYRSRFLILLFLTSNLAANGPVPFPNATIPPSKSSSMVITSSATTSKSTSETLSCRIDDDGGFCSYPGEASVVEYYPGNNNPYRWWNSSSLLCVAMPASSCSENWVSLFSKYITTASPSLYTNVYDTQTYEIYSDGFSWTASPPCVRNTRSLPPCSSCLVLYLTPSSFPTLSVAQHADIQFSVFRVQLYWWRCSSILLADSSSFSSSRCSSQFGEFHLVGTISNIVNTYLKSSYSVSPVDICRL